MSNSGIYIYPVSGTASTIIGADFHVGTANNADIYIRPLDGTVVIHISANERKGTL
jgi:hypothetical protein